MKRSYIHFIISILLFTSLVNARSSFAAFAFGNIPQTKKLSQKAGESFFESLSKIYSSFIYLENEQIDAANKEWKNNVLTNINNSFKNFVDIANTLEKEKIGTIPINKHKFSEERMKQLELELANVPGKFPATLKELNDIAITIMLKFSSFLKKVQFSSDYQENRKIIRDVNNRIFWVVNISTSLSEIGAAIKS